MATKPGGGDSHAMGAYPNGSEECNIREWNEDAEEGIETGAETEIDGRTTLENSMTKTLKSNLTPAKYETGNADPQRDGVNGTYECPGIEKRPGNSNSEIGLNITKGKIGPHNTHVKEAKMPTEAAKGTETKQATKPRKKTQPERSD